MCFRFFWCHQWNRLREKITDHQHRVKMNFWEMQHANDETISETIETWCWTWLAILKCVFVFFWCHQWNRLPETITDHQHRIKMNFWEMQMMKQLKNGAGLDKQTKVKVNKSWSCSNGHHHDTGGLSNRESWNHHKRVCLGRNGVQDNTHAVKTMITVNGEREGHFKDPIWPWMSWKGRLSHP